ncbi:hypothetical protein ABQW72_00160 [Xanthomonas hortorum pv. pelargonii]|uniref:hypothetical protein n=1 Tax=Xanthomonas hortorum TaxID=56454 RepID=UPI0021C86512|nr:hypothetical protein [Xanthomonas hortorum]MCU1709562.1 hypothetical protein [Xanthomonas hortorum pv. pelargonii]WCI07262.1 hypothetical protein PML25_22875 [Xanthomonas hortorum pv. pelargonii]WOB33003.1 hypothetical protein NYR98_22765 [Xanthomonas hortorum pv. pelargonii]
MKLSLDEMKLLHSLAQIRLGKAWTYLAFAAVAIMVWNLAASPMSFVALATVSAAVLLIVGGVASDTLVKSAVMAFVCVWAPIFRFFFLDLFQGPSSAAQPAAMQKYFETMLPFLDYLLYIMPLTGCLVGGLRLAVAVVEVRAFANEIRVLEGRSVRV